MGFWPKWLFRHLLMYVAPEPSLPRLRGCNYRMLGRMKMLRSMAILGRVAAPDMAALKASAQMHPSIAQCHALRAVMHLRSDVFTMSKMFAERHRSPRMLPDRMLPNPMLAR